MTPEEPLDDDMFINANLLANGPIQEAGVKTPGSANPKALPRRLVTSITTATVTNRNAASLRGRQIRELKSHRC
jgi:hypothetical protein